MDASFEGEAGVLAVGVLEIGLTELGRLSGSLRSPRITSGVSLSLPDAIRRRMNRFKLIRLPVV
jgi:hypothetical protein